MLVIQVVRVCTMFFQTEFLDKQSMSLAVFSPYAKGFRLKMDVSLLNYLIFPVAEQFNTFSTGYFFR